jgi:hypothetical protein
MKIKQIYTGFFAQSAGFGLLDREEIITDLITVLKKINYK